MADPLPPPLAKIRILEFAGLGPGPFAGQLLADLGADVIVVDRPVPNPLRPAGAVERRGKRSIRLDLKRARDRDVARALMGRADALIEGNRPGVMERLGLGPDVALAENPALVYGRMTGWGQAGPYAGMAGHDINYIGVTGALQAMGDADRPPPPPLNLVGDFGGGSLFLALGLLAGVIAARENGQGRVVDAAICDGTSALMGMIHSLAGAGAWDAARGANLLDGGRPYYRCYGTRDGRFMAVGCIEPQFHAEMLARLGIDPDSYGNQNDPACFAAQAAQLEKIFASRDQADWAAHFAGSDACVTPVRALDEVMDDPHMAARAALVARGDTQHPAIAPRCGGAVDPPDLSPEGGATADILGELGLPVDFLDSEGTA
ncbi:CaiB/BaiF CoA transferase family protein [Oceanomicrobium pacificus]|uniref:CoA transferase n=1 Tax=Oceanomicrobium pacificus TaxID=2692916 RepID=A0A6B0TUN0_9RHOB|nr:CaiB/BaiF CoA-transferase family protein [Oceanomicrobium pacificus]MXU65485.1 CoA transferase [Oceanomicrobium pacificus]